MHTTRQAITVSTMALKDGMTASILKHALVSDGFQPAKADTIIRWAKQIIKLSRRHGEGVARKAR